MSAVLAIASPRRIKASHRRRRKVTAGHFVQRYYDPQIGRFLSVDPAASEFNRYSYASNNPYTFTDPDGRWTDTLRYASAEVTSFGSPAPGSNLTQEEQEVHATDQGAAAPTNVLRERISQGTDAVDKAAVGAVHEAPKQAVLVILTDGIGSVFSRIAGLFKSEKAMTAGEKFFEGTTMQKRVLDQQKLLDHHVFPAGTAERAAKEGVVTTVLDSRGKPVQMLTLKGNHGEKVGTFEYIKNAANEIYHHYFNEDVP